MDNLKKLIEEAKKDFEGCKTLTELDNAKSKYIGKSGPLTEAMRGLSKLPKNEKPKAGAFINNVKESIESLLNDRKDNIQKTTMLSQLKNEYIDVTLPGLKQTEGSLHPISLTMHRIENIFQIGRAHV